MIKEPSLASNEMPVQATALETPTMPAKIGVRIWDFFIGISFLMKTIGGDHHSKKDASAFRMMKKSFGDSWLRLKMSGKKKAAL